MKTQFAVDFPKVPKMSIPVVRTVKEVREYRERWRKEGQKVGFVPTMGFLHQGHQSLVKKSLSENDATVVSIFVNPSQFAPGEDLDAYPRNLEHDLGVLAEVGGPNQSVSLVFAPTVSEIYPSGIPLDVASQKGAFVNVVGVAEQLEGKCRPAFFRGVTTVLAKLFNIVEPNNAYFGQKDVQQTIVVRKMVADLFFNMKITVLPIIRAESGLARSSRNAYLSDSVKERATCLFKSLKAAKNEYETKHECSVAKLTQLVRQTIESASSKFTIDYIAFNDPDDLHYLESIDASVGCILSMAVYVPNDFQDQSKGTTRLIDNSIFGPLRG